MSHKTPDQLIQQLIQTIEMDPVALEERGFPKAHIDELRDGLAGLEDEALVSLGMATLQVATGLANLGHVTPVEQLKAVLDRLGPRVRRLSLRRGTTSDAARLQDAARALGRRPRPQPARPGDAPPAGAVTIQAFKIPIR